MSRRTSESLLLQSAVKSVVEQLEQRFMMDASGFSALINFQPAAAPTFPGYLVDSGATYGDRGNGFAYGWDADNAAATRDRNNAASADQRYDTLIHTQLGGTFNWELAVPDGVFQVKIVAGDPDFFNSVYKFNVENIVGLSGTPTTGNRWIESTVQVVVTDGKLTLTNGDGSVNNKIAFIEVTGVDAPSPTVVATRPANNETNVSRDIFVAADLNLPNAGIDPDTLTSNTVFLKRTSDQVLIPAVVNTSGGGDTIVLQPSEVLAANTQYTFTVTSGLLDLTGEAFTPFTMSFTTGTAGAEVDPTLNFNKLPQATTAGHAYTSLTKGPDGKLYAGTIDGRIMRFPIAADGSLGAGEEITSLQAAEGGPRILTGIEFDPSSTAGNLILWVSHGFFDFENAPDWTGKISKLTGPNLATVQDVVVGLPRSIRDHLTNQMDFGPDGKLYFMQGSNTAMGAPDAAWGMRPERKLSGAVLRLDPSLLGALPLDVKTEEGGTYDPFAADAPLTIYAAGVRNGYDLVWTQNGRLYVPANGSAAGGSTPAFPNAITGQRIEDPNHGPYTGPNVNSISSVNATQNDYLFRIEQNGYYGHPNPHLGTYVLNGGNPTSGVDPAEVTQYPVGTQPDTNWRGSAFNFGKNLSPNGVIEYQGNAFGGALKNKLLVVRYSGGDDVIVLTPGANGDITASQANVTGMSGFYNPLDITEDLATGNLYVAEFGPEGTGTPGGQRITLLKPAAVVQAEYTSDDIGSPNPPGSTTVVNEGSDYDMTTAGAGVIGTSDQFRYLYKQVTGDFDYRMRINSLTEPDADSAAGLMARESLATGSRNAFMKARPSTGGYRFSYRTATNGNTTQAGSGAVAYPNVWVRLRRVGNVFTGFSSTDGNTWTQVAQQTVTMPTTIFLGAALSAKTTNGATTTAQLRSLGLTFGLTPPSNLSATPASTTQVDLTWTDNSSGESGFIVQRKTGAGGTYQTIHTTAANVTSFSDLTAVAGTQYFYRVAADGNPDSAFSNEDEATTPASPPAAPSNLAATGVSQAQVNLTWNDNSTDETGFEIQRKTGAGGTYVTIHTTAANATSYNDTDAALAPNTQYFYRVRALNGGVQSNFSNEDDGTTLPASQEPAYQQDPGADGLVVMEAEVNDGIVVRNGRTWSPDSTAGFSGTGALQATPNAGINQNTSYVSNSPRIDFKINFTKTGTHYVWIRGLAPTSSDDSVHVGLDGAAVATADRISEFDPIGSYIWTNQTIDDVVASINVTTPGIHTLNVWMREDGFILDKILLTTNAALAAPSGNGPAASPRTGGTAPSAASNLDAIANSPTSVNLTWTDNSNNETGFKVMRKTGAGGTYAVIHTTAAGATSYVDTTAAENTTYFYKIVATNLTGDAPDSNEDSVTTPAAPVPGALTPNQTQIEFNDPNDANPSGAQTLTITNNGASPITIPANGVTIVGADAARFTITSNHSTETILNQGQSLNITVTYTSDAVAIHDATLRISNNSSVPQLDVRLRGLGTAGEFGENEPALQRILDLYRIPVNVGDDDTGTTAIPYPPIAGNDEVNTDLFQKAGPGNVTIEALGTFGSFFSTFLRFGHYVPGNTAAKTELFSIAGTDAQTVNPTLNGVTSFDPGANAFGIYTIWPEFSDREVFSEDQFNTWEANANRRTKVRFWPLKNPDGTTVPNAYIFGFEEAGNHDLQDFAGIIRNVIIPASGEAPAFQQGAGPDHLVVAEAENNDGVLAQSGKTWSANSTAGFSGTGALQATPNTGVNRNTGYVTQSPRIDFAVNFTQTGTHYVWLRGFAPTGSDDTVHVGFDGAAVTTSDRMNGFPDGVYTWSNSTMDGPVATINVTTPGIHTLNVWMREDGFILDKVLVTTNAAFVPTGNGPLESPRSANAPAAPTNLQASAISETRVDLTWDDNSSDETGFKIHRKDGAGGAYSVIHTTAANIESYSDTTAAPGRTYFYRVSAAGESDSTLSNEASASTPQVAPNSASDLTATNPTSSSMTLNWNDNSTNESGFKILRKQGVGGTYGVIHTTAADVTTFLDTQLSPDTQYFYQVVATNNVGDAAPSNEASQTTQSVSSTPAFQQGGGPDHLVVAEVENNDGVLAQGGKTWAANSQAGFSGSGALQATPNTGINRNTDYLTNSPRIDFNINFTQTGTHYVWLRGFAPSGSDDTVHVGFNGAAVTTSDRMNGFGAATWTWSNSTMDGPVATINVTTPGIHTLNVWMREDGFIVDKVLLTTNAAYVPTGAGPAESPHSGHVAPAAPTGLNVTNTTATSVALAWADNASTETGYKILRKTGAGGTYQVIDTTAADATTYTDTTALPNTDYFYKVVATNGFGDSGESNEVQTTTLNLSGPDAPTGLDATAQSASSIGLTWNDVANESEYRIERKIGAGGIWAAIQELPANSTSYTNIDLDAETTYFYRVVAVNAAGEAPSNEDSATTPAAPATFNSSNINTPLVGTITTITEGNAYDITGGGLDVYDVADSFHFANQSRNGDFDIRVQISSFTAGDPKAKAGLMVRESLGSGAVNLFAGVTIGDGYRFSRRASADGTTTNVFKGSTVSFPNAWVRLRRVGNQFTAYRSTDGQNWTQMGQVTQALPATVFFGLATSSKSNSATATAQYRNLDELPVPPSTNQITWVDGVDAPLAVQETLSAQVGNQLFVMGGYMSGLIATRTSYKLNLDTNVWTQIADLPNAQTHVAVASDGTYIYAVGGQIGDGESTNIVAEAWKYHIATNTWSSFTGLPEARAGGAMVYHNGFLHFFGGVTNDRVTVSNNHWAIPVNESTGWVAKADLINPGDHLSGHELNGKIYAIGGEHDHGFDYIQHDSLSEYDPNTDTWTSKAPLPVASSHFEGGTLVIHGRLVLLGGQIDGQLQTDAVRSWDPATNTWTVHSNLPLVRKGGSSAFWNNKVLYTVGRGKNVNGGPVYSKDTWVGTFQNPWWTSSSNSSSSQSQPLSAAARRTFFNDSLIAAGDDLGSDDDLNIVTTTSVVRAPAFAK